MIHNLLSRQKIFLAYQARITINYSSIFLAGYLMDFHTFSWYWSIAITAIFLWVNRRWIQMFVHSFDVHISVSLGGKLGPGWAQIANKMVGWIFSDEALILFTLFYVPFLTWPSIICKVAVTILASIHFRNTCICRIFHAFVLFGCAESLSLFPDTGNA